jgi:hypothetical protein
MATGTVLIVLGESRFERPMNYLEFSEAMGRRKVTDFLK